MKTNVRRGLLYMLVVCFILALASSGKNKVEVKVPQDSAIVVEEESVVIEVDTLIPDTTRK